MDKSIFCSKNITQSKFLLKLTTSTTQSNNVSFKKKFATINTLK